MEERAYPPKERRQFQIQCEDLNHKNELVQYILLKEKTENRSRLLCRKCIEGKFNQQTNEICLISDVLEDPYNALKYTKYQDNVHQIFSDFLHSYDFSFNEEAIHFKIDEIRQSFLYYLSQVEQKLIEKYQQFETSQEKFKNLSIKFEDYFKKDELEESLNEAEKKFGEITTKDKQALNKVVNDYVAKFHSLKQENNKEKWDKLMDTINNSKQNLNNERQLKLFKCKLDQGLENILKELQNMELTFSTQKFRQSELSNTYMDKLIEKINPIFKEQNNIDDKIKRIYQSKYDGLNSMKVFEKINKLGELKQQTLIFIFKTPSQQIFGVYHCQNSSLIFQQNKLKEFTLKPNVTPLVLDYNGSDSERLMTFGKDDIIIKSSFTGCISYLGEGFLVDAEHYIGDSKSYLANQTYFDIVEMEIFQILK